MCKHNIVTSSKIKFWKLMVMDFLNLTHYPEHKFVVRSYSKLPTTFYNTENAVNT